MAIKKSKIIYTTDRGQEYELPDMKASHLMNAINHHETQLATVEKILKGWVNNNLMKRAAVLKETITLLTEELAKRDPDLDDGEQEGGRHYADHY